MPTANEYYFADDQQDSETFSVEEKLIDIATPETSYAAKQIAETVNKAIDGLPEELKQAITLREIDGMSYEEIAEVMDCPVGTVRSRIFRAREAIAKRLQPHLEGLGELRR